MDAMIGLKALVCGVHAEADGRGGQHDPRPFRRAESRRLTTEEAMPRKPKSLASRTKPFQRELLLAMLVVDPKASTFYEIMGQLPTDHAQDAVLWELSALRGMGFVEHGSKPGTWQLAEAGRTYWQAFLQEIADQKED
jgi:hypothetical protein